VSATTTGLMSTCRRLQQILSGGDRLSPAPVPMALAVASTQTTVGKSNRRATAASARDPPRTPVRRASSSRVSSVLPPPPSLPKAPVLVACSSNKRTRSAAFDSSPVGEESDNSDKDFNSRRNDRFATPPPRKRVRPTTPPPAPNRGVRGLLADSDDEDEDMSWTSDDDRQLVELVLGRLQLSKSDWEECARSLGKGDGHSVGKRWEGLLGNISLKDRRKRIGRHNLYSHRRILPRN